MAKKKGKKMTNPDKPKTNSTFFGHEIIKVKKVKFRDGQTVGSYLKGGGSKSQLRAAVKSGAVELELPEGDEG